MIFLETYDNYDKYNYDEIDKALKIISEDEQLDYFNDVFYIEYVNIEPGYDFGEVSSETLMEIVELYNKKDSKLLSLLKKHNLEIEDNPDFLVIIFHSTLTEEDWKEKEPIKWRNKMAKKFNI